jgi:hypothetical protein
VPSRRACRAARKRSDRTCSARSPRERDVREQTRARRTCTASRREPGDQQTRPAPDAARERRSARARCRSLGQRFHFCTLTFERAATRAIRACDYAASETASSNARPRSQPCARRKERGCFARKRFGHRMARHGRGLASCVVARDERARRAPWSRVSTTRTRSRASRSAAVSTSTSRCSRCRPASEVLMSALTIPDMKKVVERHGHRRRAGRRSRPASPRAAAGRVARAAHAAHTSRDRRALVSGRAYRLEPCTACAPNAACSCSRTARRRSPGADYKVHPQSDVAMFSFGPIKTATALRRRRAARARSGDPRAHARGARDVPVQSRAG